jgi:hypothetical protein
MAYVYSSKNWRDGHNRFFLEVSVVGKRRRMQGGGGEVVQTIYAHMNKRI